jgi:hypothetical protein
MLKFKLEKRMKTENSFSEGLDFNSAALQISTWLPFK